MSPWTIGEADWILNMKITRNWDKGTLHLSQPAAIEKLATQFSLAGIDGRAPHVPMSPTLRLTKPSYEPIIPAPEFDYQSAVGGFVISASHGAAGRGLQRWDIELFHGLSSAGARRRGKASHSVSLRHEGLRHYVHAGSERNASHCPGRGITSSIRAFEKKTMLRRKIPTAAVESSARFLTQIL